MSRESDRWEGERLQVGKLQVLVNLMLVCVFLNIQSRREAGTLLSIQHGITNSQMDRPLAGLGSGSGSS